MFERARRRLTLVYAAIFALVLALFSVVFWVALGVILQPTFDLVPDVSGDVAADVAYRAALDRAAVSLIAANGVAIAAVAVSAWFLADRTLRPIRDATGQQARFVADASHEIRTPLASIRTTAEAALLGERSAQELRSALETVVTASDRLAGLANDLLVLARADAGDLAPEHELVDLSVAVAETVDEERSIFEILLARRSRDAPAVRATDSADAAHRIAVSLTPDLRIRADAGELRRIVRILVENAVIHGGGRATVRTLSEDGEAVVEVSDRGPGIAANDLDRIFEPFYRNRSDADAAQGTGLGLAIAASLARRNRGRITVESKPGTGSTFRVILPAIR